MENNEDYLEGLERAKKAAGCPLPQEARNILHLSIDQFCKLLDISSQTYWALVSGEKGLTQSQRIFLKEAIRIAKEKGFI